MDDKKGDKLSVGDLVYVLPEKHTRSGGKGYVRKFTSNDGGKAFVDNGPKDMLPITEADRDEWTWAAWVRPNEVEKL